MNLATLTFRYTAFAVVATIANLGIQRLVLLGGMHWLIYAAAVFLGTLVGLATKFILDKFWIFREANLGLGDSGRKFALYTVMGIATTAIFWATETAFFLVGGTAFMRELGAVIGLGIGYTIKFRLDRRFVFTDSELHRMAMR